MVGQLGQRRRFLSTPSARRATHRLRLRQLRITISIHALREEGDTCLLLSLRVQNDFYPRPPRGGRRYQNTIGESWKLFLSTPSARRATQARGVTEE